MTFSISRPPMPKALPCVIVLSAALLASPAHAQVSDRTLLSTFCNSADIKGKTCKRAKTYPNAPKSGCDVTLGANRHRGRFIASANYLLVLPYESGCESHATDDGGTVVLEQIGE